MAEPSDNIDIAMMRQVDTSDEISIKDEPLDGPEEMDWTSTETSEIKEEQIDESPISPSTVIKIEATDSPLCPFEQVYTITNPSTQQEFIDEDTVPVLDFDVTPKDGTKCPVCDITGFSCLNHVVKHMDICHPQYRPKVMLEKFIFTKMSIDDVTSEVKITPPNIFDCIRTKYNHQIRFTPQTPDVSYDDQDCFVGCRRCLLPFPNILSCLDHCVSEHPVDVVQGSYYKSSSYVRTTEDNLESCLRVYRYMCEYCLSKFTTLILLIEHKITAHFRTSMYFCNERRSWFNNRASYVKQENLDCRCECCFVKFSSVEQIRLHRNFCSVPRNQDYLYTLSLWQDKERSMHKLYMNRKSGYLEYICLCVCLKHERHNYQLVQEDYPRSLTNYVRCFECQVPFKSILDLTRHHIAVHDTVGMMFYDPSHDPNGQNRCNICDQNFGSLKALKLHLAKHFPQSFRCGLCHFQAPTFSQFSRHIKAGDCVSKQSTLISFSEYAVDSNGTVHRHALKGTSDYDESHEEISEQSADDSAVNISPQILMNEQVASTSEKASNTDEPTLTGCFITDKFLDAPACEANKKNNLYWACNFCKAIFCGCLELLDHHATKHPKLPAHSKTTFKMPTTCEKGAYVNKVYCCEYCGRVDRYFAEFLKHKLSERNLLPFHCIYCSFKTDTWNSLPEHYTKVHSNKGVVQGSRYRCSRFNVFFKNRVYHRKFHSDSMDYYKTIPPLYENDELYQCTTHHFYRHRVPPYYRFFAMNCPADCDIDKRKFRLDVSQNVRYNLESTTTENISGTTGLKFKNTTAMQDPKNYALFHNRKWFCIWKCSVCGLIKSTDEELLEHFDSTHGEDDTPLECPKVSTLSSLLKPCYRFACELCREQFLSLRHLVLHKLLQRPLALTTCEICGQETPSPRNLLQHYLSKHLSECESNFANTGKQYGGCGTSPVNSTIRRVNPKTFRCYMEKDTGLLHYLSFVITTYKKYKVVGTKFNFTTYTDSLGIIYICNICDAKYKFPSQLKKHVEMEHRNEFVEHPPIINNNIEQVNCSRRVKLICQFGCVYFHIKSQFDFHFVNHYNLSVFGCPLCGASFPHRIALREHHRSTLNMKPHEC